IPFLSMVRSACAETRSLTQRFSLATQKRRSCRLGRKRRRVLLLACETLLPVCTRLPETWHTRDIAHLDSSWCLPVARGTAASMVAHHTSRESKGYAGVGRPGTCSRGRRPIRNRTQRAAHYAPDQGLAQLTHRPDGEAGRRPSVAPSHARRTAGPLVVGRVQRFLGFGRAVRL